MARPERNNVDYFPFICEDGNKMFYVEETYGNDGFATFVKLLRELAKSNYHYLDLSKPSTMMFLSAKCKVSKDILESIIKDLVELGKFDKVLWNENKVIWCQDFIDSIQDAYVKRNNKCITYEGLILLLTSLGVRKPSKLPIKGDNNTQSIEEYSKVEKSKENETKIKIRELVYISDVEHETLRKQFTEQDCNWMYDKLNNYKLSSGKTYKSDYGAINSWVKDELKKHKVVNPIKKATKEL